MEFFDISYNDCKKDNSDDLYTLRRKVFKDRLGWSVECTDGYEFDEYDNSNVTYIYGVHKSKLICSLRLIDVRHPNMITGTFYHNFSTIYLPDGDFYEASRFFVDKERARSTGCYSFPLSAMLFLAVLNFTRANRYEGILAIVNGTMLNIISRSGWRLSIISEGTVEGKAIYLLQLPVDEENQQILIDTVNKHNHFVGSELERWPLQFRLPG